MWSDNESSTDLLGFDPYASLVAQLVLSQSLLPLTVGVFGDWGSGKSTLLQLVESKLSDEDVVVVKFQPWLHKDFDDVRSALMVAILEALEARKNAAVKVAEAASEAVANLFRKLANRVDWMRVVGFAGKAVIGAAATAAGNPLGLLGVIGAVSDATDAAAKGEILKEDGSQITINNGQPVEQGLTEFRKDFSELIDHLKIKALVVLVDDVDRCLPTAIINVLEAIRLFLSVPKTAFVIGADERIVRAALATNFPEAQRLSDDLGREYLEKIIQIPVAVPKLSDSDIEGYLNILVMQLHLEAADEAVFEQVVKKAEQGRTSGLGLLMNYGIAKTIVGEKHDALLRELEVVSKIAPVLARLLGGRPREVKRFLNTLYVRRALAEAMKLPVAFDVLAKMTVLEYFHTDLYEKIYGVITKDGVIPDIESLEQAATGDGDATGDLAVYITTEKVRRWLTCTPSLNTVDLRPYFTVGRDRLSFASSGSRRLAENLQEIVRELTHDSEAARKNAVEKAKALSPDQLDQVFDAMAAIARENSSKENLEGLINVGALSAALSDRLAGVLRELPTGPLSWNAPSWIQLLVFKGAPPGGTLAAVLETWEKQSQNKRLATAARQALRGK